MENTLRSYAVALLALMRNQEGADGDNPPLGWARRWETQSSIYNLAAHRLLQALVEHPPSPEANRVVAQEFMAELAKCGNSTVVTLSEGSPTLRDTFHIEYYVQVNSLNGDLSVSPGNWAEAVYEELSQNGNILPLTDLAGDYLNNLILPCRVQCTICHT